jgi:ferredoxin/coenzyme F420-reducing hydrogenase delta subunit
MRASTDRRAALASRALEAAARRVTGALDAALHRAYGWRWNPLHQSGALAAWLLVVLTVTGVYLLLYYRLGAPAQSVQRIAADPWLGAWMRSLHRYATDAFVVAAVLHALRLVGHARDWGPRTRAWLTGVFLLGVGLVCAWTGFVMAWDSFGIRLAVAGARLLDVLPVLSEPVGRIFAGDRPVPDAFFFLNLFIHIALPLAMGAGLWLHVSKVARPALAPPRALKWTITGVLAAMAVLLPAPLGPAASPLLLPTDTPVALTTAWWLPLAERMPPWAVWSAVLAITVAAVSVPFVSRRPRTGSLEPSVVDPRLCTGCDQCTQDCPWGAIQMIPRDDDRPTLVARVDPALCVSCGICAGSCPPMGVGPPRRTGRDQLAQVRGTLLGAVRAAPRDGRVVVICCGEGPATARRKLAAAGALIHEVPCVGALHSSVVEILVRQGAMGVMIAGCPPRDCVGREGPKWLEQRTYHGREAELQERVDRVRVRLVTTAVAGDDDVVTAFGAFRRELLALAVSEAEETVDLRELCDAAPEEVGA